MSLQDVHEQAMKIIYQSYLRKLKVPIDMRWQSPYPDVFGWIRWQYPLHGQFQATLREFPWEIMTIPAATIYCVYPLVSRDTRNVWQVLPLRIKILTTETIWKMIRTYLSVQLPFCCHCKHFSFQKVLPPSWPFCAILHCVALTNNFTVVRHSTQLQCMFFFCHK